MNIINTADSAVDFRSTPITGTELLLGCGNKRDKQLALPDKEKWDDVVTLDIDPDVNPDVLWDMQDFHLPFDDETFEEVHAYDVLEHIGQQGDWRLFFAQFTEIHRILKPGGHFMGITPTWDSIWAWSDPGHSRVISEGTIHFLSQDNYNDVGKSNMTDYRHIYKVDFSIEHSQEANERFCFVLKKK